MPGGWREFTRFSIVGLLLGGALGMALTFGRPSFQSPIDADPERGPSSFSSLIGSQAPDFELTTPEGRHVRLSDHRGKLVIVNFWATWCGPCRLEMPTLQEYQDHWGEDELIVLAVNFDEEAQAVGEFGRELGITFPLLLDPGAVIQDAYRVRAYPTTYFIDRLGIIRQVHLGMMTEEQVAGYLAELER